MVPLDFLLGEPKYPNASNTKIIPSRNCHFLFTDVAKPGVQTVRDGEQYGNARLGVYPK